MNTLATVSIEPYTSALEEGSLIWSFDPTNPFSPRTKSNFSPVASSIAPWITRSFESKICRRRK